MRAFIKKDRWEYFIEHWLDYGYLPSIDGTLKNPSVYKKIDVGLYVIVDTITKEIHLVTPHGSSPFMEVHAKCFQELIDNDLVEFVKGKFD